MTAILPMILRLCEGGSRHHLKPRFCQTKTWEFSTGSSDVSHQNGWLMAG